jgi:hypothetical protein
MIISFKIAFSDTQSWAEREYALLGNSEWGRLDLFIDPLKSHGSYESIDIHLLNILVVS